jgi:flagellar hook-associated protein 2
LDNHFDQVVSLFQDIDKFGSTFRRTLDSLGTSSTRGGAIALALKEDQRQADTLNDNIDRQEALIATQKEHLTAELNYANQILQSIPQLIQQVDEMYSAITGYKSK